MKSMKSMTSMKSMKPMTLVPSRRTVASAALLALLLPLPLAAAGTSFAAAPSAAPSVAAAGPSAAGPESHRTTVELPRPTGRFAVGREDLHLVDRSRTDPWAGSGPRELMVTMRYPARHDTGRTTRYLTSEEARLLLVDRGLDQVIPVETLTGTLTGDRTGARPVAGRYPLIVLSPGFTVHRATLTALAEDLASRGYVVAAVDHAYESVGTAFPGGRVLRCLACEKVQGEEGYRTVSDTRSRDVSFLLDRLTGRSPAWRHAGLIDKSRIAMAGHSIGGASTAAAMAADHRIRAGINMDGGFSTPVPAAGLDGRPFMLLGAQQRGPGGNASWDRDWPLLDGWKRWITFADSGHFTFTDFPAIAEQLGLPDDEAPLPGARSVELTRRYVAAFFDQHLRGSPQPALDGPSPDAPEVRFHTP
ncbi:platelet-activating factor acetylhydrolase isoform II [Streptomyces sp. CG 926]|uniref:alpha/beta hydrolase family protein n=1 Tax=Streptomyces sp. CG 926 TaxID=1882405 RepID=UPI000D7A90DC|nr:alpha/beta hydrolase [Streptomyces sp. CG 926]PWK70946.1 platelet-activating factor acetylhydrolase isoform II [Streptomyces sp. CG 926]